MISRLQQLEADILGLNNDSDFTEIALELFAIHSQKNQVYQSYLEALEVDAGTIGSLEAIPFLPIELFKDHQIGLKNLEPELVFRSSGTSSQNRSSHAVYSSNWYNKVAQTHFESMYGPLDGKVILGLLPSYADRSDSSLVHMVHHFMAVSGRPENEFYLDNHEALKQLLWQLAENRTPTILFGVTFALLDIAQNLELSFPELLVLETGGMKGRGEELIRAELHERLRIAFPETRLHSEYGMTELLSQAYMTRAGHFTAPEWMKIFVRDVSDPLTRHKSGSGALDILDLANLYSCPFVSTMDLGRIHGDSTFDVLGRIDHSDIRGCSLLTV